MRFQELLDADNQRNNTHIDFEKQLNLNSATRYFSLENYRK